MAEIQGDTGGSSADQTTAVSDEGASFGGGGVMDWSWIGDMVDGSVTNFHDNTIKKQRARGYDACILAASIEEGWYTQIGPAWWKSSGLARTVSNSLSRSISEAVVSKGRSRPFKYDNAIPLWEFMIQQVDGTWIERAPYFESVALTGDGVFDALKAVAKLVLKAMS